MSTAGLKLGAKRRHQLRKDMAKRLYHAASSRLVYHWFNPSMLAMAVGCGTHRYQSVLSLVSRGISVASKVITKSPPNLESGSTHAIDLHTHTDTRQHQRAVSAAWRPRTVASFTCERQSYLPTPPAHRAHLASSYLPTPKSSRRGRVVTVKKNVTQVSLFSMDSCSCWPCCDIVAKRAYLLLHARPRT